MTDYGNQLSMPAQGLPAHITLFSAHAEVPGSTSVPVSPGEVGGSDPLAETTATDYEAEQGSLAERLGKASIELVRSFGSIGKIAMRGDLGEMLRSAASHF